MLLQNAAFFKYNMVEFLSKKT